MHARIVSAFLVLSAAALAACSGTGTGGGGGGETGSADPAIRNAPPVTGNCLVSIRLWNRNRDAVGSAPTTAALVNTSSDWGQKLSSGRASSTEIRVLADDEMGRLLAALESEGFGSHARPDVTLESVDGDGTVRGVLVVKRDGVSKGIPYYAGSSDADVFRRCRDWVIKAHSATQGFEVRATMGGEDPERTFQAPPIKPRR